MEGFIMRKLIAALIALVTLPVILTGCGGSAEGSAPTKKEAASVAPAPAPAPKAPVSHTGTWKAEGFEANVTKTSIEVNIVSPDSSSLYWKGTFEDNNGAVNSKGDREALDMSLLGSQDKVKAFTVSDDEIVFKMSMMGTTRTVHLKKA